jgi:hypothetical protein
MREQSSRWGSATGIILHQLRAGSAGVMLLTCPICSKQPWHTENGLAAHVWHDHPESRICMGHGNASLLYGDPAAERCARSVMAACALRLARSLRVTPRSL